VGLWDWVVGLLETLGIDIMNVLADLLPADLFNILQMIVDVIGILPVAKVRLAQDKHCTVLKLKTRKST
jgi:hypothetical protein